MVLLRQLVAVGYIIMYITMGGFPIVMGMTQLGNLETIFHQDVCLSGRPIGYVDLPNDVYLSIAAQ